MKSKTNRKNTKQMDGLYTIPHCMSPLFCDSPFRGLSSLRLAIKNVLLIKKKIEPLKDPKLVNMFPSCFYVNLSESKVI